MSFQDYESRLEVLQKQVDRYYPDKAEEEDVPLEEAKTTQQSRTKRFFGLQMSYLVEVLD